ncbi:hypothetical protein [Acidithiobacillus ferridurans]|uniref:Uncharacterized protein n=1 Tax=Acidithiobacillus ferridurans TaxID=1232575 RepID=A0A8X8K990_ACIFI|nr:hypothetical protein [Acidithiobacillus ferridurans]MBU2715844.1 hypothetical protein [Acidithiobacillus ferridurans]MBU2722841.1 hypothetical protein [Acidithiobacillus ferridurans]MBU2727772.1 hypothetical protein [Acidithiobacillus ferridurans]
MRPLTLRDGESAGAVVALDCDRVILDFEAAWCGHAEKVIGVRPKRQNRLWNMGQRYGVSQRQAYDTWAAMDASGWTGLNPLPWAEDLSAWALRLAGEWRRVHVVTALAGKFANGRLDDLHRAGFPILPENLHCVGAHGIKEIALCQIEPQVYIDDDPAYVHAAIRQGVPHPVWLDYGDIPNEPANWLDWQALRSTPEKLLEDLEQGVSVSLFGKQGEPSHAECS